MKFFSALALGLGLAVFSSCNSAGETPSSPTTTDTLSSSPEPVAPPAQLVCYCGMDEQDPEIVHIQDCDEVALSYVLVPDVRPEWSHIEDYAERMFSAVDDFLWEAKKKEFSGAVVAYYDVEQTKKAWTLDFTAGLPNGTLQAWDESGLLRVKRVYDAGVIQQSGPDLGVIDWRFDAEQGEIVISDEVVLENLHLYALEKELADQLEAIAEQEEVLNINGNPYTGKLWLHRDVDGFDLIPNYELNYQDGLKEGIVIDHFGFHSLYWVRQYNQGALVEEWNMMLDDGHGWDRQQQWKHRTIPRPSNQQTELQEAGLPLGLINAIRPTGLFVAFNDDGPEYVTGDWNGDGEQDAAVYCTSFNVKDGVYYESHKGHLLVFAGAANDAFTLLGQSGDLGTSTLEYASVPALKAKADTLLFTLQNMLDETVIEVVQSTDTVGMEVFAITSAGSNGVYWVRDYGKGLMTRSGKVDSIETTPFLLEQVSQDSVMQLGKI